MSVHSQVVCVHACACVVCVCARVRVHEWGTYVCAHTPHHVLNVTAETVFMSCIGIGGCMVIRWMMVTLQEEQGSCESLH